MISKTHNILWNKEREIVISLEITDSDREVNKFILIPEDKNCSVRYFIGQTHYIRQNVKLSFVAPFGGN